MRANIHKKGYNRCDDLGVFFIRCEKSSTCTVEIFFLFYYPHILTIRLKRPVYRGFSGEGKMNEELRMKKQRSMAEGKANVELSASPIKNYTI